MEKKRISWSSYLYMGLLFAVIMMLRNEDRDAFYQLILIGVFFVLTGIKENIRKLTQFMRQFPLLSVATTIWTIYFGIINRTDPKSYRFAIIVYFILFAGYSIAQGGEECLKKAFERLWAVLLAMITVCIAYFVITRFEAGRMYLFFMNPNIEGYAIIAFLLISVLFINHKILKIIGIIVSIIAVSGTGSKGCAIMTVMILFGYIIAHMKEIVGLIKSDKKAAGGILAAVISVISFLAILFVKYGNRVTEMLGNRFSEAFSDIEHLMNGGQLVDYYSSTNFRLFIIKVALETFPNGNVMETLFGRGMLRQYYDAIRPIVGKILSLESEVVGPAENTFLSLLYDYGAISFAMFCGVFFSSMILIFRAKEAIIKKITVFIVCMMALNMMVDMEYWPNVMFIVWMLIGILLGSISIEEKRNILYPCVLFSGVLVAMLYILPLAISFSRTMINGYHVVNKVWYLVMVIVTLLIEVLASLLLGIGICSTVSRLFFKEDITKGNIFTIGIVAIAFIIGSISANLLINIVYKNTYAQVNSEKDILSGITENAVGRVFVSTFPEVYEKEVHGISRSLFHGRELTGYKDVTIVTDINTDEHIYDTKGFLYTPISDKDAIYSNDEGAIEYLKKQGRHLTSFCTFNNDDLPEYDIHIKIDDKGQTIKEEYYDLEGTPIHLDGGQSIVEYEYDDNGNCTLEKYYDEMKNPILYNGQYWFVKRIYNNNNKILKEEYFGTDNRLITISNGTCGNARDYNEEGLLVKSTFFGEDGYPILNTSGFASIRFFYNEKKYIIREEYYDTNDNRIALYGGEAAVQYEYDENGNVTKITYLDTDDNVIKEERQ